MSLFIGLMSGSSLDGVDGVLAEFDSGPHDRGAMRLRAHEFAPLAQGLRAELLRLNATGDDELHRGALAANALMRVYANVVHALLRQCGVPASQVRAIGAHGQTVRHRPQEFDGTGYTLQLMNGALLAELCGIDVVCDLRSRDVAAGGQGAPLVPALHAALFAEPGKDIAVLNLGGIANLTWLAADGSVRGFDCGPGNVLLDLWCQQHQGTPFDAGGRWAASGQVDERLLQQLLSEPFLQRPAPKQRRRTAPAFPRSMPLGSSTRYGKAQRWPRSTCRPRWWSSARARPPMRCSRWLRAPYSCWCAAAVRSMAN